MTKILLIIFFYFFSFSLYGLTIKETIKNTINNNTKVKIGLEKIKESKELISSASGELLPDIYSTITGTYESSDKRTLTTTTEDDTLADKYKLIVTQNLFDSGYNKLEIDRSKILFDNEIINFNLTINNLILDAITGYLSVLNYENFLKTSKKNFETVTKFLEETKIKFDSDSATLYELQLAESSFALSQTNLYLAQQNLLIGQKSFKRIVGLEPINLESIIKIDSNIKLDLIEKNALQNNLSLLLLKLFVIKFE